MRGSKGVALVSLAVWDEYYSNFRYRTFSIKRPRSLVPAFINMIEAGV